MDCFLISRIAVYKFAPVTALKNLNANCFVARNKWKRGTMFGYFRKKLFSESIGD